MGTVFRDLFLPELEHELASTRKVLALVPEGRGEFRPHPKSSTLGALALHVASLPSWAARVLGSTDLHIEVLAARTPPPFESVAALLATFEEHARGARTALSEASDADLSVLWSLKRGGKALFTLPRHAALRSLFLSHLIHHRGQLTVYLRLVDVALPQVYGPTADAPML